MLRRVSRMALALAVALGSSAARADVVSPDRPRVECPRGAGADTHSSACVPLSACETDDDCPGYYDSCQDAPPLCVERPETVYARTPSAFARGLCAAGDACPAPATCERTRRCLYDAEEERRYHAAHPPPAPPPSRGGCAACAGDGSDDTRSASVPPGLVALSVALAIGRRARRRAAR